MKKLVVIACLFALFSEARVLFAGQPLETETARPIGARKFSFEGTYEYQTSSEGTEAAAPIALEYGITDRLEILVEPVFYTDIHPKVGRRATGMGDTELTLTYLFFKEKSWIPAMAFAGEVKFPTANDTLIGTKQYDYTAYFIASKKFGKFDTHINLGYTVLGKPPGVSVQNTLDYALAGEYRINDKFELVGEIVGNTSSGQNGGESGAKKKAVNKKAVSPEVGGEALNGMLGGRYYIRPTFLFSLGVSYDNNNAILFRPGFTWYF